MLNFNRLTLLRELQLRGSITGTAKVLGISPSAVSQQLAKLEREAGRPLLEQAGRTVRLTPAAQQLAASVDEAVMILEGATARLEAGRHLVQGVIRFAAFGTFARAYLPQALARMAQLHPDVVVEFTQLEPSEALSAVASRRADIAIVDEFTNVARRADSGLVRSYITSDQMEIHLPRRLSENEGLGDMSWVFEPRGTEAYNWSLNFCRDLGFEPRVLFESPDPRLHHELVAAGVAAAILPRMAFIGKDPTLNSTTRWDPPDASQRQLLFRRLYAVGRRGRHLRPAFTSFLQVLDDVTTHDDR